MAELTLFIFISDLYYYMFGNIPLFGGQGKKGKKERLVVPYLCFCPAEFEVTFLLGQRPQRVKVKFRVHPSLPT